MNKSVIKLFVLTSLMFVALSSLSGEASANVEHPFASGAGTENDPYIIETADQLDQVRNYLDAHFELGADIDLSGYGDLDGKGWNPIGAIFSPFTGSINGNQHTISNLTIKRPDEWEVGLFGYIKSSTIEDLYLLNASITGGQYYTAGIAGGADSSIIRRIAVNGTVESGGANYTGGIVGNYMRGTLSESIFIGDVHGTYMVGGMIGYSYSVQVKNVFVEGTLDSNTIQTGGMIGYSYKNTIKNSYTTMKDETYKHFIGIADNSSIHNSFGVIAPVGRKVNFLGDDRGNTINNSFLVEKNNYSIVSELIYPEWNNTIWTIGTGNNLPRLKALMKDQTSPVTSMVIPEVPETGWFNKNIPLEFSVNEDATIQYRKNGGDWIQYTTPESLGDGVWTVEYFSKDEAGNVEDRKTVQLKIDTTKPLSNFSVEGTKGKNDWYVSDPTLTLSPEDRGSGIDTTEFRLNKGEWMSYEIPVTLQEGMHYVEFRSTDVAGNVEDTQTIDLNVDTTVPELEVGLNKYNLWSPNKKMHEILATLASSDTTSQVDSVELVSITSNEDDGRQDDIQGVEYGTEDTEFSLRAERSGKKSGRVYTITYLVTDYAGNDSIEVVTVDVPHDKGKR
ncbi:OmpL47-type beta-barrel domain-containing protein [Guptibacillus hwajinpoensis]|uniref:OmpL47-type beta-barrel domain-containing protein n=1 Tax=Guptibacillus hwajinpoensis TaxID=208199 RepID=UPI003735A152